MLIEFFFWELSLAVLVWLFKSSHAQSQMWYDSNLAWNRSFASFQPEAQHKVRVLMCKICALTHILSWVLALRNFEEEEVAESDLGYLPGKARSPCFLQLIRPTRPSRLISQVFRPKLGRPEKICPTFGLVQRWWGEGWFSEQRNFRTDDDENVKIAGLGTNFALSKSANNWCLAGSPWVWR